MRRTTVFLTDDLDHLLEEAARRTRRSQAEIIREALARYLDAEPRPWPRSVGMGKNADQSVTSDNVKEWVRERWRDELAEAEEAEPSSPRC